MATTYMRYSSKVNKQVKWLITKDEAGQIIFDSVFGQKHVALFILNASADVLFATNRFDPNCIPHLDDVLTQERICCS